MKAFYFLAIVAVVVSACEKKVIIDIPQKSPKLVVNGLLDLNQVVELTVGKSRHVLEANNTSIETYVVKNAVPVLYENNIAIDTLVYQPLNYTYKSPRGKTIAAGNTYTVKVTAPGFTAVETTSTVPSQSEITEVSRIKHARVNSNGEDLDEVTIKFSDPVGEKNYYLLQILEAPFDPRDESWIYCVSTTDKDIEPIGDNADPLSTDNCYDGGSLIMKDDNFNGREKQLRFYIHSSELDDRTGVNGQVQKPSVKLSRITEAHFKFIKSFNAYNMSGDNPFAEPANVFTNVVNGYGIFSARTSVRKYF
ncbi:MAG: DUF4249 domain-containing protein [Flavisolibacter sp.]